MPAIRSPNTGSTWSEGSGRALRGDIDPAHAIYREDAVLEWPQSGERFVGKEAIKGLRGDGSGPSPEFRWCAENVMTDPFAPADWRAEWATRFTP